MVVQGYQEILWLSYLEYETLGVKYISGQLPWYFILLNKTNQSHPDLVQVDQ